jgi:hypothetical protein
MIVKELLEFLKSIPEEEQVHVKIGGTEFFIEGIEKVPYESCNEFDIDEHITLTTGILEEAY